MEVDVGVLVLEVASGSSGPSEVVGVVASGPLVVVGVAASDSSVVVDVVASEQSVGSGRRGS